LPDEVEKDIPVKYIDSVIELRSILEDK